ncbi:MAG: helix-turn-helix domain-containing protein [Rhodoferax sp.]|nr:helix-turn-helix domain-containing protein [Rhodoferax sp.]
MTHDYMTGAELQALREACGLDRDQLGERCGVQGRSIKYWETGNSNHGVPADVAALVLEIANKVDADSQDKIKRLSCVSDGPVVLFRTADPVKNEVASRVYLELRRRGQDVRMVAFSYPTYRAWLDSTKQQDTPAAKHAWGVLLVKEQAKPHRADQPA